MPRPPRVPLPPDPTLGAGHALAPGSRLEYFEIERVISKSDLGIVYLATDLALEWPVVIKEYLPASIATRVGAEVRLRGPTHIDAFERGRAAFVTEARMLARCDHTSLVRVSRLMEANGTAYRVMPFYYGESLQAFRRSAGEPPNEAWVRALLDHLLGALETLHHAGVVHGNVVPGNILLHADDRPVLLDFDAVRQAMVSDRVQSLMAALESPVTQVFGSEPGALPQSPAGDLHALAAVARFSICGEWPGPTDSTPREPLTSVVQRLRLDRPLLHYDTGLLNAIDAALVPHPQDWPQSVAAFRESLARVAPVLSPVLHAPRVASQRNEPTLRDEVAMPPVPSAPATTAMPTSRPGSAATPASSAAGVGESRLSDPASAPPSVSMEPRGGERDSYPGLRAEDDELMSRFDADAFQRAAAVTAAMSRKPPLRSRLERTMPWALAGVLVLLVGSLGWRLQQQREAEGVLGGLAKVADSEPMLDEPGMSPSGGASASGLDALVSLPPAVEAGRPTAPQAYRPSRAASAPQPAEDDPVDPPPTSPRAACGTRTEFALYRCMQLQCAQAQWMRHSQCVAFRANDNE